MTIPFTPGPLRACRQALQGLMHPPATHHRERGFIAMLEETSMLLKHLLGTPTKFPVRMTCTGTGANESVLRALSSHRRRGLLLHNGYFADRLLDQARRIGCDLVVARGRPDAPLTEYFLRDALAAHPQTDWVYFVAHETRAGLRNETEAIAAAARAAGRIVAVDAISAAFAYPVNFDACDFVVASSAKGINSVAGLGIVFGDISLLDAWSGMDRVGQEYLDLVGEYYQQQYEHRPLYAQSIPLHSALHGACHFLTTIGMSAHFARIQRQMQMVIAGLGEHNLVLPPQYSGNVAVNFKLPVNRRYTEFARAMEERGFFLLCGIPGDETHYQVSTLGSVSDDEVAALIRAIHEELAS